VIVVDPGTPDNVPAVAAKNVYLVLTDKSTSKFVISGEFGEDPATRACHPQGLKGSSLVRKERRNLLNSIPVPV